MTNLKLRDLILNIVKFWCEIKETLDLICNSFIFRVNKIMANGGVKKNETLLIKFGVSPE